MVDALGELLRAMRLSGGVFLDAELAEPWCIRAQVEAADCRPFMPVPSRLIAYHYVIEGRLLVSLDGWPPMAVASRQLIVLPRNDAHLLASACSVPRSSSVTAQSPSGASPRKRTTSRRPPSRARSSASSGWRPGLFGARALKARR